MALVAIIILNTASILTLNAASISEVSVNKPTYGVVRNIDEGSYLTVRQGPSASTTKLGELYNNDAIMIIGASGNFYQVMYNVSGNLGYVSKTYVEYVDTTGYLVCNVDSGTLNMRSGVGSSYEVIASIPKGTAFGYVTQIATNGWYRGVYGNKMGYTTGAYTRYVQY